MATQKEQQEAQKSEMMGLKSTLDKELTKEQPNIKEITDRIVKQELEAQRKVYESDMQTL
jgi:hypothetical protein